MEWESLYGPFKRGGDLDASCNSEIQDIRKILVEYWDKLFEISLQYGIGTCGVNILVSIWMDTGQVISELKDESEFARISITDTQLANAYCELPDIYDKTRDFTK